jgi:uncharacterized cupin superfamily protein
MDIKIEKLDKEKMKRLGLPDSPRSSGEWNPWECEPSTFNWQYSDTEIAYVYEGKVKVKTDKGEVEINKGDFVTFPKGLACTWQVLEKIRKVYKFE